MVEKKYRGGVSSEEVEDLEVLSDFHTLGVSIEARTIRPFFLFFLLMTTLLLYLLGDAV